MHANFDTVHKYAECIYVSRRLLARILYVHFVVLQTHTIATTVSAAKGLLHSQYAYRQNKIEKNSAKALSNTIPRGNLSKAYVLTN